MKQRLLIVGCGDIALRAAPLLHSRYLLLGLARNPQRFERLRAAGIRPIPGDLDIPASLDRLAGFAHLVVHLAPPSGAGIRDRRTANLLAALTKSAMLPHRFVYISTSGVYGDCGGGIVSETHRIAPATERAKRRADAERRIREWGRRNRVNISVLRVPGIYAGNRLPLERLKNGTPALVAEEDSYVNHIHADDLARIVAAVLRHGRPCRLYHVADDAPMKMGDYFDLVAERFGLPRPARISREAARFHMADSLWSFLAESKRLANARVKRELRVKLRYPSVVEGLSKAAYLPGSG